MGKRLTKPGSYAFDRDRPWPTKAAAFPRAARYDGKTRHVVEIGSFPVWMARSPLHRFLRYEGALLSVRATAGFLSRAEASSLRFKPGFLEAVRAHLDRMRRDESTKAALSSSDVPSRKSRTSILNRSGMTMAHLVTDPARRALMQRVRRSGTPAEEEVAACCRKLGLAYRRNLRSLPGSPDLANKSRRWAIFVNGCFWHHHTSCAKATLPKRNRVFWSAKLESNRRRDAKKIRQLRAAGYRVLLLWECKVSDEPGVLRRLSYLSEARFVDTA